MYGYNNPYLSGMYQGAPQMNQPQYPQAYGQQNNMLPPQQVLQVDGKTSVDTLRMSPNSSVLLMDKTAPIVWLCTSDGLGNVTSHAYDITPHQDAASKRSGGRSLYDVS